MRSESELEAMVHTPAGAFKGWLSIVGASFLVGMAFVSIKTDISKMKESTAALIQENKEFRQDLRAMDRVITQMQVREEVRRENKETP